MIFSSEQRLTARPNLALEWVTTATITMTGRHCSPPCTRSTTKGGWRVQGKVGGKVPT